MGRKGVDIYIHRFSNTPRGRAEPGRVVSRRVGPLETTFLSTTKNLSTHSMVNQLIPNYASPRRNKVQTGLFIVVWWRIGTLFILRPRAEQLK